MVRAVSPLRTGYSQEFRHSGGVEVSEGKKKGGGGSGIEPVGTDSRVDFEGMHCIWCDLTKLGYTREVALGEKHHLTSTHRAEVTAWFLLPCVQMVLTIYESKSEMSPVVGLFTSYGIKGGSRSRESFLVEDL